MWYFNLTFLLLFLVSATVTFAESGELAACDQADDKLRLACYDRLRQDQKQAKINGLSPAFLGSEVRVVANLSEYSLTVDQLLKMIDEARHNNGQKIEIGKWRLNNNKYQLDIKIRDKIYLTFSHQQNAAQDFSVLSTTTASGGSLDAANIILTIAAMTPDEI